MPSERSIVTGTFDMVFIKTIKEKQRENTKIR